MPCWLAYYGPTREADRGLGASASHKPTRSAAAGDDFGPVAARNASPTLPLSPGRSSPRPGRFLSSSLSRLREVGESLDQLPLRVRDVATHRHREERQEWQHVALHQNTGNVQ